MRTREGLKAISRFSLRVLLTAALTAPACTNALIPPREADCPEGKPLPQDFRTKVAALGPFEMDKRQILWAALNDAANRLWHSSSSVELKKEKGVRFKESALLILLDRDQDGHADEFAYVPDNAPHDPCHVFFRKDTLTVTAGYGLESQDFGFLFDLNKDGKVDYIVFNGGPENTKKTTFNREELKAYMHDWFDGSQRSGLVMWDNYHLIDSNADRKMDILVFNAVDLNGDGMPDEGMTAWVYDSDFDGVADRGEYLGTNFQKDLERKDGTLVVQRLQGRKVQFEMGNKHFTAWDTMLFDLNSMLH